MPKDFGVNAEYRALKPKLKRVMFVTITRKTLFSKMIVLLIILQFACKVVEV